MSTVDALLKRLREVPKVDRFTAEFVGMSGGLAVINVGDLSVTVPCAMAANPTPGTFVQVEKRGTQLVVIGPAVGASTLGVVASVASGVCTVTVDGVTYSLSVPTHVTGLVAGNTVAIDWGSLVVLGKVTAFPATPTPDRKPGAPNGLLSEDPVFAADSGSYRAGWWTNDVHNEAGNTGAWFYGTRLRQALSGATVTKVELFLDPRSQSGNAPLIGLHTSGSIPGGNVTVTSQVAVEPRDGWVTLPTSWGVFLRDNTAGIGVSPSGYTIWRGTQSNALSGALRFAGTR